MANWSITTRLRSPNATTAQAIQVVYRYGGTDTRISCGFKCHPKHWDNAKRRVKAVAGHPSHIADNAQVLSIVNKLTEIIRRVEALEGDLSTNAIKAAYKASIGETIEVANHMAEDQLAKWWTRWLKSSDKRESTVAAHLQTRSHVLAYDQEVTWAKIDFEWLTGFTVYCEALGHGINQIAKTRKNLKAVMRAAWDNDKHSNTNFRKSWFKVKFEAGEGIALTDDELQLIATVDLESNEKLNNARNLFLLNCWTGASYRDNVRLSPATIIEIDGKALIDYTRVKSSVNAALPIHPSIAHIVTADASTWPRPISNQKQNKYIKQVALLAGIDENRAGMVTTTTGRRTFITFMLSQGVDPELIRGMTGHKTERAFAGYSRFSAKKKALQTAKLDVFN